MEEKIEKYVTCIRTWDSGAKNIACKPLLHGIEAWLDSESCSSVSTSVTDIRHSAIIRMKEVFSILTFIYSFRQNIIISYLYFLLH